MQLASFDDWAHDSGRGGQTVSTRHGEKPGGGRWDDWSLF